MTKREKRQAVILCKLDSTGAYRMSDSAQIIVKRAGASVTSTRKDHDILLKFGGVTTIIEYSSSLQLPVARPSSRDVLLLRVSKGKLERPLQASWK